jgi:hypothetical protein
MAPTLHGPGDRPAAHKRDRAECILGPNATAQGACSPARGAVGARGALGAQG